MPASWSVSSRGQELLADGAEESFHLATFPKVEEPVLELAHPLNWESCPDQAQSIKDALGLAVADEG